MARILNCTATWFIKYFYYSFLHFTLSLAFFCFVGARPTGSKLPCADGCKHIRLALGVDNHLIPQWTFLPVHDASGKILSLGVENRLVSPDELEANLKHQILGLNIEDHLASHDEARDELEHKVLVLGIDNYLVSIQGTIRRRGEAEEILTPNTENQVIPFKNNVYDNARETPFLNTQSKTLLTQHFTLHNFMVQELYHGSGKGPALLRNGVGDVAEESVLLVTGRQQVSRQNKVVQARTLDTGSDLVLPMNEVHNEDYLNIENQLTPLRSIIHRAEPEDGEVITIVELGVEQESLKPKLTMMAIQSMAGPPLPTIMPSAGDPAMGSSRKYSSAHSLTDIPHFSEWNIKTQKFTRISTLMPVPTVLAKETPPPQETLYGDPMTAFGGTLYPAFGYPPGTACFGCVLGVAIGLSTLLSMTSLLLLCCLSRKGQYVWINTINIAGVQNPANRKIYRPHHIRHDESRGITEERSNEISSGQGTGNIDSPRVASENIDGAEGRSGADDMGSADRLEIASRQSPNRLTLPGEWITPRNDIRSANRSVIAAKKDASSTSKSGPFQNWLNSNPSAMKKPGVFQRLFSRRTEKHVNFDDTPLRDSKDGWKIHSNRTRNGEGPHDPSIILAEVAERLIGERIRQLSTILSVGEEEEALAAIVDPAEEETSSMSSIRAVATGSTMGTQRRDNTVRRNRHSVSRAFNDMDGVATSLPMPTNDGMNMHREVQGDVAVGEGESGISTRSLQFEEVAGQAMASGRETCGRASVRQYLFPTVEDDNTSTGEAPYSEDTANGADGRTIVQKERQKEQTVGACEDLSHAYSNDLDTSVSANSTTSRAIGAKPERQLERDAEVKFVGSGEGGGGGGESGETGSSIGDDSTLIVGPGESVELAESQLSMEQDPRPELRETLVTLGFAMGSDLVLNQAVRTEFNAAMEEVVSDGCGISAFGLRAKSPRWDSQTSNGDSELSSYFSGNSSGNENTESELGNSPFIHPADCVKRAVIVESKMTMHSALNGQLGTD